MGGVASCKVENTTSKQLCIIACNHADRWFLCPKEFQIYCSKPGSTLEVHGTLSGEWLWILVISSKEVPYKFDITYWAIPNLRTTRITALDHNSFELSNHSGSGNSYLPKSYFTPATLSYIYSILEPLPTASAVRVDSFSPIRSTKKKIFIVHGHDLQSLNQLQNCLRQSKIYDPIVLNEEDNNGADTIIEKLERIFSESEISAAIVLATPDDRYNNNTIARCRPNVELELGFVMARLTRRKVVFLRKEVEATMQFILPSDISGVVYTPFQQLNTIGTTILRALETTTKERVIA